MDGNNATSGGKGQGSTTRCPFNNKLYASGGSGNSVGAPSDGGGGKGGNSSWHIGDSGTPNTGGGGGGGWSTCDPTDTTGTGSGTDGGSGIIVLHYLKRA